MVAERTKAQAEEQLRKMSTEDIRTGLATKVAWKEGRSIRALAIKELEMREAAEQRNLRAAEEGQKTAVVRAAKSQARASWAAALIALVSLMIAGLVALANR